MLGTRVRRKLFRGLFRVCHPPCIYMPSSVTSALRCRSICRCCNCALLYAKVRPYEMRSSLSRLLPASNSAKDPGLIHRGCRGVRTTTLGVSAFFKLASTSHPLLILPLCCAVKLSMMFDRLCINTAVLVARRDVASGTF